MESNPFRDTATGVRYEEIILSKSVSRECNSRAVRAPVRMALIGLVNGKPAGLAAVDGREGTAAARELGPALIAAEIDGGRKLSEPELLGFCFQLVLAGNDTTTNLIANGTVLLAHLAANQATVQSAAEVAAATGIALPTVSKLLKSLARADLVVSTRGVRGGYRLSRPPQHISAADVIDALEDPEKLLMTMI